MGCENRTQHHAVQKWAAAAPWGTRTGCCCPSGHKTGCCRIVGHKNRPLPCCGAQKRNAAMPQGAKTGHYRAMGHKNRVLPHHGAQKWDTMLSRCAKNGPTQHLRVQKCFPLPLLPVCQPRQVGDLWSRGYNNGSAELSRIIYITGREYSPWRVFWFKEHFSLLHRHKQFKTIYRGKVLDSVCGKSSYFVPKCQSAKIAQQVAFSQFR